MISGGVSRFAKHAVGIDPKSAGIAGSLSKIKQLAQQERAEDKFGSLAAAMQIRIMAVIFACIIYTVISLVIPSRLQKDMKNFKNFLDGKYKVENQADAEAKEDVFDILISLIKHVIRIMGGCGIGYFVYRKIHKRNNNGKTMAEIQIEEEISRLREALEKQDDSSDGGPEGQKFAATLDGTTLVELFNGFAEIMAIRGDLPRIEDETALEYFRRIASEIRFPVDKAERASRYFEDELYGKKETTVENRKAFLELILSMMEKVKPGKKA